MLACEWVFQPKRRSRAARERLQDRVEALMAVLGKNGQVVGDEVLAWTGGALRVTCYVPRPDALAPAHWSSYGREHYGRVLELCDGEPSHRVIDDGPWSKRYPRWRSSPWLYLSTTVFSIESPVHTGKGGHSIPLYLLPLADDRERVIFWMRTFQSCDYIWLHSGALEMPAYQEMADPRSDLAAEGRDLCRTIEAATGRPTYYHLHRYYARRVGEAERPCPSCGQVWAVAASEAGNARRANRPFEFRCEPCRLVSHQGDSVEDVRHARIGDYRPPRRERD